MSSSSCLVRFCRATTSRNSSESSVTPVRDAIQKLAEEDLVEIFAQSTTRVTEIDLEHARQSHFLRVSVEMEAVLLLASGDYRMQLKEIRKQLKHQKEALQANAKDVPGLFDLSFHRQLCEVANVGKLWSLIRAPQRTSGPGLRRLFHPEPKRGLIDGLAILTAIEAGDALKAQMLLRQHHSRMMLSTDESEARIRGISRITLPVGAMSMRPGNTLIAADVSAEGGRRNSTSLRRIECMAAALSRQPRQIHGSG